MTLPTEIYCSTLASDNKLHPGQILNMKTKYEIYIFLIKTHRLLSNGKINCLSDKIIHTVP